MGIGTEIKVVEMPPRRKRKASQGETKAKKSREDSKIRLVLNQFIGLYKTLADSYF